MERAACCAHCAFGHKGVSDEATPSYGKGNDRELSRQPMNLGETIREAASAFMSEITLRSVQPEAA
jgi:hypothetical protein